MNRTPKRDPKTTPKRPKTTPKRAQTTIWGGLGPFLGALVPSWDGLGSYLGTSKSQDRKQDRPGPIRTYFLERFWLPKWHPKRPQNESKIKMKNTSCFDSSWSCLGAVLGRSWVVLGRPLGSKTTIFRVFLMISEQSRFLKNNRLKALLDRSWAVLG